MLAAEVKVITDDVGQVKLLADVKDENVEDGRSKTRTDESTACQEKSTGSSSANSSKPSDKCTAVELCEVVGIVTPFLLAPRSKRSKESTQMRLSEWMRLWILTRP